jgi:hypothetical protein
MSKFVLIAMCLFAGLFVFCEAESREQVVKDEGQLVRRLEKQITLEFTRTPLGEAIAAIADASGTQIDIDRRSLKFEGYTQNISQTFSFKKQPARVCLQQILNKYEPLVVCIDRANSRFIITTKRAVKQQKLETVRLDRAAGNDQSLMSKAVLERLTKRTLAEMSADLTSRAVYRKRYLSF